MATLARALAAAALLGLAGCHAYYPYGYGYGGAYTVPQGTYVPQGTMVGPGPQAQLQPTPYTESPVPQPGPGRTADLNTRPLPDSLLNDAGVPKPREAAVPQPASKPNSPKPASLTDDDADDIPKPGVKPTGGASLQPPGLQNLTDETEENAAEIGDDSIPQPGRIRQTSARAGVGTGAGLTENDPSPYAFDRENYTYLRGIVEFDEAEGFWRIQYDTDSFADQYSGVLTLSQDERLDNLLNKDVVLLKGRIDMKQRDSLQKPMYVIESAQRLRPRRAH